MDWNTLPFWTQVSWMEKWYKVGLHNDRPSVWLRAQGFIGVK